MKSALLITYYWPPAGGAGVHRWLRFSKYFKENGWNLHVYCPKDAAWPIIDEALLNEVTKDILVVRHPIFEPHKYISKHAGFNQGAGLGTKKRRSIIQKLVIWIRGNLFIPDSRRYWIKPSTSFLTNYLKEHSEISTIISTGPPHSTHVIARNLKRKLHLKWVTDFRDPWTEIDFYNDLNPGKWADKRQKQLEGSVLKEADVLVTISKHGAERLSTLSGKQVHVITNGYNFEDFNPTDYPLDNEFTISHFGSMSAPRNPQVLWEALHALIQEIPTLEAHLKIKLIGHVDYSIHTALENLNLKKFLIHIPEVKHEVSIRMQRSSQVLLLVANNTPNVKGILTGKFFEYLGAKRPVLAIGAKDSDLEREIIDTNCGLFIGYDDLKQMMTALRSMFYNYLEKNLHINPKNIDRYSSSHLAKQYANLLNSETKYSNE